MIKFNYSGQNLAGDKITGIINARTRDQAIQQLEQQGITVIELDVNEDDIDLWSRLNIFGYPAAEDLIIFSRQMHAMLRSGIPIMQAINVVAKSCKNQRLHSALTTIGHRLEAGHALAGSLGRYPKIFPTMLASLVNVGEQTGTLDQMFHKIANHLDKDLETRKRVKSAMRYPSMVIATVIIAMIVMNLFVIPSFTSFFAQFKLELPLSTRILIKASNFSINYWWLILIIIVTTLSLWFSYLKTHGGRLNWDHFKLRVPLLGSIIERALLAQFGRSFALCFRSGVPLLEAIHIIAITIGNTYMQQRILTMKNSIERGEKLTVAAKNTNMFTELVLQMILIGEESGQLDRLLDEVANFYETELDHQVRQLSSLIEPILIGIIGIMVLVLALGIFLPMWDLAKLAMKS